MENLFEIVAAAAFRRSERRWKPGTTAVNRSYLRSQIMPSFAGRDVAAITARDVRRWHASLYATPGAANRSVPILSMILRYAEGAGHRPAGDNPCAGIRRYRRRGRDRFLTADEYRRLGLALADRRAAAVRPAAIVELLLLTGCRQSEIRHLEWRDYRAGHLHLRDSKTGPRMVWLSSPSRRVLDGLPRTGSWVFPAAHGRGVLSNEALYGFWRRLRTAAQLPDLRLHDLRHSYASYALRQGEPVLTISRLLGHRSAQTTLRYVHFADSLARDAVERVGEALR